MSKISKERQLWIYRVMNEIRLFEEKAYDFSGEQTPGLGAPVHRRGDCRRCDLR